MKPVYRFPGDLLISVIDCSTFSTVLLLDNPIFPNIVLCWLTLNLSLNALSESIKAFFIGSNSVNSPDFI